MLELRKGMPAPPDGWAWCAELNGDGTGFVALLDDYGDEMRQSFKYSTEYPYPAAEQVVMAAEGIISRISCAGEVARLTGVPVHAV